MERFFGWRPQPDLFEDLRGESDRYGGVEPSPGRPLGLLVFHQA
jgi:hypothetical protein